MGALNPLFLVAGIAIAVPIFLHLFHRHETRRFSFPALRYLERTEREHAREIRFRQLLLLLTRIAVLLLLVGAGARLVFSGRGASHPATAVAIVLDNSMSSGLVVGETRVLDELKGLALRTLDDATDEDRFWVIRAGEPWLPAIPGTAADARAAVAETEASAAAGDLTAALQRAVELLGTAELADREIHLLSDMQRTAFDLPGGGPAGAVPVVAWAGTREVANRALAGVLIGGGLPPLEGQRTELTVRALDAEDDTTRWPVRVLLDGRIRGAGSISSGSEISIALPVTAPGWVVGYVDADPDELRADDRRYFAYRSRAAPRLAVAGDPEIFVEEALAALTESGRVASSPIESAELLLAEGGSGLAQLGLRASAVVIPPEDPTVLPALNRRLVDVGIAWRYEPRTVQGEAALVGPALPLPLRGVTARAWYRLVPAGESAAAARELARAGDDPWAIEVADAEGRRSLLLASPLVDDATTLPVSTGMVRFLDWLASQWAVSGGGQEYVAGDHLPAPAAATHVRFPSGRELEIDGTRTVRGTGEAGLYTFTDADTTVAIVAVNASVRESRLDALEERERRTAIGPDLAVASDPGDWSREVYRTRRGPELWWPLLLIAALLLLAESVLASSGRGSARPAAGRPKAPEPSGAVL